MIKSFIQLELLKLTHLRCTMTIMHNDSVHIGSSPFYELEFPDYFLFLLNMETIETNFNYVVIINKCCLN